LLASQVPEFLQQYRQRLGGAAGELTTVVRHFDEDSRRSGYQRHDALQLMKRNPERLIRDQALRMEENVSRLDRLSQQQEALSGGVTLEAFFAVLANYDPPLVEKTYDNFIPALPLTFTSLMFDPMSGR
jgi:exonuclease VII large subunit